MNSRTSLFLISMITLVGITSLSSAQTNQSIQEYEEVYVFVEKMPEFIGGKDSLKVYLSKNIDYSKAAQMKKTNLRVLVAFIVTKEGNVIRPNILKSVSKEMDEEALRVVASFPKWKPGIQDGKAVNTRINLPIDFK